MPRDNFTKATVESLGKRVGFLCSNPACGIVTVGPHTKSDKVTITGVAAHITAASEDGPRYDKTLTTAQRRSIDNGIWLCATCSTLIDKDPKSYPVSLLLTWKMEAELRSLKRLQGISTETRKAPFIEADLIWDHGGRMNMGFSNKNPSTLENGVWVTPIGQNAIAHWKLDWHYTLMLHNNTSHVAINLKIENIGDPIFHDLDKLDKLNNLQAFHSVALKASYGEFMEGQHQEADKILRDSIPKSLDGLKFKITYKDEERNDYATLVTIDGQELISIKL